MLKFILMKKASVEKYKYIYFILSALLFLMLSTRSSFLYPFNNWDDANSYFSMGKALFGGMVPYRDIFDQKGMYLYFEYGLSYLVSHTTFAGVFLIELVCGIADISGFYKILRLYSDEKAAILLAPLSYAVIVSSRSFWWGGSAEELCLPLIIFGLRFSLDFFKNQYPKASMPFGTVFTAGILAGFVANIKYTLLGFYFAWMMMVFFSYVVQKKLKAGIKACFVFLAGMFIPFIPWIIYFAIKGALYYWYWGYVYVNVFVYSDLSGEGPTLYERVYNMAKILYWLIIDDWQYFVLIIPGMLYGVLQKGLRLLARINIIALAAFLFVGIFVGGLAIPYYSLPLSVFSVMGAAFIAALFGKTALVKKGTVFAHIAVIVLSMIFIYFNSINTEFMKQKREDLFLYHFRDIVEKEQEPTLLNIGCLDAGLYTLCDITPHLRYFQTQTINVPEEMGNPYTEQDRYIKAGAADFIIARDTYPEFIFENYDIIAEEQYGWYDMDFTYYLFRKK